MEEVEAAGEVAGDEVAHLLPIVQNVLSGLVNDLTRVQFASWTGPNGATPLVMACPVGNMDWVVALVELGVEGGGGRGGGSASQSVNHVDHEAYQFDGTVPTPPPAAAVEGVEEGVAAGGGGAAATAAATQQPLPEGAEQPPPDPVAAAEPPASWKKTKRKKRTPLMAAAGDGHTTIARYLLEHNADVNLCNSDAGVTPVFCASQDGHLPMLQLLIGEYGAKSNPARKTDGATPLLMSAQHGHYNCCEFLLLHDANPNDVCLDDGTSALKVSAAQGHLEVVKLLLAHGALQSHPDGANATALFAAAAGGHLEILQLLVDNRTAEEGGEGGGVGRGVGGGGGGGGCCGGGGDSDDSGGSTASEGTDLDEGGADASTTTPSLPPSAATTSNKRHAVAINQARLSDGATPIMMAAMLGHMEMVRALIAHGADLDMGTPRDGVTPLYSAALKGQLEVVELLLAHGADLTGKGANAVPLFGAVGFGKVPVLQCLLAAGADPNYERESDGATPLRMAVMHGDTTHLEVAAVLLAAGANPNTATRTDGMSPLMIAAQQDGVAMVELLLLNKADPNLGKAGSMLGSGATALLVAAQKGNLPAVQLLATFGCSITQGTTDSTWTPTSVATTSGHTELVRFLAAVDGWSPLRIGVGCGLVNPISKALRRGMVDPDQDCTIKELVLIKRTVRAVAGGMGLSKVVRLFGQQVVGGWSRAVHHLHHLAFKQVVRTLVLVGERLWRDAADGGGNDGGDGSGGDGGGKESGVVLPPEIWLVVAGFLLRSDWPVVVGGLASSGRGLVVAEKR
jgi:ankyrin repeat protein